MLTKRYEGYLNTPCLWQNDEVFNLRQLSIASIYTKIDIQIDNSLRLGKYIERLVSFELKQHAGISILAENIQIQKDKRTLGELDCLLLKDDKPIHLEIIYKFYLYDESVGNNEIAHFIGPNRKDALIEKLTKLKEKQLPLLYSSSCKPYLDTFKAEDFSQQVYFKAQLFLPYTKQNIRLKTLNNACVIGCYITEKDLNDFKHCKFYIPTKKDWLITPHANIAWKNFDDFKIIANGYFKEKFSTLCWVKCKNGSLKKIFLVWW
ncbi:hypothetical protein GCM10022291_08740 [Postechiella marina]|uniref:DUF1853 family protein n=1 Tax=Postechiella marina TaxID=943941 RepID=A0ABP8C3C3_9FLAO